MEFFKKLFTPPQNNQNLFFMNPDRRKANLPTYQDAAAKPQGLLGNSNPMMGLLGNPYIAIGSALLNPRQSFGQNLQQGFQNLMQQQMYKAEQDRKNRSDQMQLALLQNQLRTKRVGSPYKLNTESGPVLMQAMSDGTVQNLGTPPISKSSIEKNFDFLTSVDPRLKGLSNTEAFEIIQSDPRLSDYINPKQGDTNVKVELNKPPTDKTIKRTLTNKLVTTGDAIQRLTAIAQQFDPSLLEYGNQFGAKALAFKEKLGMDLSPEQKSLVARTQKLAANTLRNLNLTIKEITGATMAVSEAARIKGTIPSLDDSPTEFKTNLDDVLRNLKLAQARTRYILTKGFEYKDDINQVAQNLPLDTFEKNVMKKELNNIIENVAKQAEKDGVAFDANNLTPDQEFQIDQEYINLFGLM